MNSVVVYTSTFLQYRIECLTVRYFLVPKIRTCLSDTFLSFPPILKLEIGHFSWLKGFSRAEKPTMTCLFLIHALGYNTSLLVVQCEWIRHGVRRLVWDGIFSGRLLQWHILIKLTPCKSEQDCVSLRPSDQSWNCWSIQPLPLLGSASRLI